MLQNIVFLQLNKMLIISQGTKYNVNVIKKNYKFRLFMLTDSMLLFLTYHVIQSIRYSFILLQQQD